MKAQTPVTIRYFPFSPEIPWSVRWGKYIEPQVSGSILRDSLSGKDIVVAAFGGLLESFYSFSILEMMNYLMPGNQLYWVGNSKYYSMLKLNGLAKPFDKISQETLKRFPIPLFFDKDNCAYFNCLNNYLKKYSYYLKFGYKDKRAAIKQIVENGLISWSPRFIPKWRYVSSSQNRFGLKTGTPYIIIVPDSTGLSQQNIDVLRWTNRQIRSFVSMLYPAYKVLILSTEPGKYFGMNAEVIPFSLKTLLELLPKAYGVLSKDVDVLFLALGISNAKLFACRVRKPFYLCKNAMFLGKRPDIYEIKQLTPEKAWQRIIKLGKV